MKTLASFLVFLAIMYFVWKHDDKVVQQKKQSVWEVLR